MSAPSVNPVKATGPEISDLSLILDKLERIERLLAANNPPKSTILNFSEVPAHYPKITVREIRSACCNATDGPRKFKPGHVSIHEIEAWIKRREQKQGIRST